jgi:hypothetical protein
VLQDKLDPVEHDSLCDGLEHDVLPDTDWLEDENDTLLIWYSVSIPAKSVSQSPPHICIGLTSSAILTSSVVPGAFCRSGVKVRVVISSHQVISRSASVSETLLKGVS